MIANPFDITSFVSSFIVIIMFLSLLVLVYCFVGVLRKGHKKASIASVVAMILCVSVMFVASLNIKDNYAETKEAISVVYNLEVEDLSNLKYCKEGKPSAPTYARIKGDDKRIYEIYFVKEKDMFSIYTKNNKGVYLPVTPLSGYIESNNSSNIKSEEQMDLSVTNEKFVDEQQQPSSSDE